MYELVGFDRDMRGENQPVAVIAELAARQHGVVARWQLRALGIGDDAIDRLVAAGLLHPIHRGVYAVGHPKLTARGRTMAAVLAYGSAALASHRTAAWLLELLHDSRSVIDVSVPGRTRTRRAGIRLHLPRALGDEDRAIRDGIPCTSVARTLLDVAATSPLPLTRRAFEEADRQRVLDLGALNAVMKRAQGHRGAKPLRALVAEAQGPPPDPHSPLEQRFLEFVRRERLARPALNAVVEGFEVDAVWPDRRLVVEVDSWSHHGARSAFEQDRERDMVLSLAGFRVIRITDRQLRHGRRTLGERLRRMLACR